VVTPSIERIVRHRANYCCEYCRLPEAFAPRPLQIDHVHAKQHIQDDSVENLALSCDRCNAYKGPNVAGIDPTSRTVVPLFSPRTQSWQDHFSWDGPRIIGRTTVGLVTVHVLSMNQPDAVALRAGIMRIRRL